MAYTTRQFTITTIDLDGHSLGAPLSYVVHSLYNARGEVADWIDVKGLGDEDQFREDLQNWDGIESLTLENGDGESITVQEFK